MGSLLVAGTAFAQGPGMMQGRGQWSRGGEGTATTTWRGGMMRRDLDNDGDEATSTARFPMMTGNGQPIIGGKVTAVNGNSLTVTNASNVTYTVDVTSAKV